MGRNCTGICVQMSVRAYNCRISGGRYNNGQRIAHFAPSTSTPRASFARAVILFYGVGVVIKKAVVSLDLSQYI
jgi:hypothetical protein